MTTKTNTLPQIWLTLTSGVGESVTELTSQIVERFDPFKMALDAIKEAVTEGTEASWTCVLTSTVRPATEAEIEAAKVKLGTPVELPAEDAVLTALIAATPAPEWTATESYDDHDRKRQIRDGVFRAITPEVGMGGTIHLFTDSYAVTVIEVSKSGKMVTVRRDAAKLLNGFNSGEPDALEFFPGGFCGHVEGHQRYSYTPDPAGQTERFSRRVKTTRLGVELVSWVRVGDTAKGGTKLTLGRRVRHHDHNF